MAAVTPRILHTNLIHAPGTILSCDSADVAFPPLNLMDQARGRRLRTSVGWTIVAGFNDVFIFWTDDGVRIANIVPGYYATGAALATAITAACAVGGNSPITNSASLWLRADAVTLTAGGLVSQMSDISGNGRHAVQATAGLQPLWVADAVNGRPGIYFDGTANMRLTTTEIMSAIFSAAGQGTVIAVFRLDSDASAADTYWWAGSGSEFAYQQWVSGTSFASVAHDTSSKSATKVAPAGVSTWHAAWWMYDQANLYSFVDDLDDAAATGTAMTGALHANILASGLNIGSLSGTPFKGYLLELICFRAALSQAARRKVTEYLKGRYPSVAANDTTTAGSYVGTVTATYSATTKKFTFTNVGGTTFNIPAASGAPTESRLAGVYKDVGMTLTDHTAAGPYTSEAAAYQSRHVITADLGAAAAATAGVALDHNAGVGGTVTVRGNASDLWLAPTLSEALSGDAAQRSDYWASQSFRFWQLVIDDTGNADGYSEIGVWFLGTYDEPPAYSPAFSRGYDDLSTLQFADHGAGHGDERPQRGLWSLHWRMLLDANKTILEAFQEATPRSKAFFFLFDSATLTSLRYVHRPQPLLFVHNERSLLLWDVDLVLLEALP